MPSTTTTSPYASAFITGVNNGTPCTIVVSQIAAKCNKPVSTIYTSLYNCGLCFRQKFNSTWIYWPTFVGKTNANTPAINTCQANLWQCFVDWCVCTGCCTPLDLNGQPNQKALMLFCRSYFGRQFTMMTGKSKRKSSRKRARTWKKSRRTTAKARKHGAKKHRRSRRKSWTSVKSNATPAWNRFNSTKSYKFPTSTFKSKRYVNAA